MKWEIPAPQCHRSDHLDEIQSMEFHRWNSIDGILQAPQALFASLAREMAASRPDFAAELLEQTFSEKGKGDAGNLIKPMGNHDPGKVSMS